MIVCHCRAVNDRQLRTAIHAGASDRADLAQACDGAGTRCGGCWPMLERLLDEAGVRRDDRTVAA